MAFKWVNGDLKKDSSFCKIGKQYPINCDKGLRVCDPVASSFGDLCGFKECKKKS